MKTFTLELELPDDFSYAELVDVLTYEAADWAKANAITGRENKPVEAHAASPVYNYSRVGAPYLGGWSLSEDHAA